MIISISINNIFIFLRDEIIFFNKYIASMFFIFFLAIFIFTSPVRAQENSSERIFGNFGILELSTDEIIFDTLILNGKVLLSKKNYMKIQHHIKHDDREYVLISNDPGGNAYQHREMLVLILEKGGETLILSGEDFSTFMDPNEVRMKAVGDRIVIDLGFEKRKQKKAVILARQILIEHIQVSNASLDVEDCRFLYDLLEKSKVKERCVCGKRSLDQSMMQYRDLARLEDHPGFRSPEFFQYCAGVCETGVLPDPKRFASDVCNHR